MAAYTIGVGTIAQTTVHPREVLAAAYATPGAKKVWMAHNHPSGHPEPSDADIKLTKALIKAGLGKDVGVEFAGHVIIANGKAISVLGSPHPFDIPPASRKFAIPIMERRVVRRSAKMQVTISSLAALRDFIENQLKPKEAGLILLDARGRVSAWLPVPIDTAATLRTGNMNTGASAIFRGIARFNALSAIAYVPSDIENSPDIQRRVVNVGNALKNVGVTLLDVMYRGDDGSLKSGAQRGFAISNGRAMFSKLRGGADSTVEAKAAAAKGGDQAKSDAKALQDAIQAHLKAEGINEALPANAFSIVKMPFDEALQRIAAAFGKRVVTFHVNDEATHLAGFFEGATRLGYGDPKVIYLRDDTSRPHLAVLGHEMAHTMAEDDPALFKRLVETLKPYMREREYTKGFASQHPGMASKDVREEFIGDVFSDGFMSDKFWRALGQKSPNLLMSVRDAVQRLMRQVADFLGVTPRTAQYLKDFDKVMEIAGKAVAKYGGGGKLKFSTNQRSDGAGDGVSAIVKRIGDKYVVAQFPGTGREAHAYYDTEEEANAAAAKIGRAASRAKGPDSSYGVEHRAESDGAEGGRQAELGLRVQRVIARRTADSIKSSNEALKRQGEGTLRQAAERVGYCFKISAEAAAAGVGDMVIGLTGDGQGGTIWHAVVQRDGATYDATFPQWFEPGVYEALGFEARLRLTPAEVRNYIQRTGGMAPDARNQGLFDQGDDKPLRLSRIGPTDAEQRVNEILSKKPGFKPLDVLTRVPVRALGGKQPIAGTGDAQGPRFSIADDGLPQVKGGGTILNDAQSKEDIEALRAGLEKYLRKAEGDPGITVPADAFSAVRLPHDSDIQRIAAAFGKRVVAVRVADAQSEVLGWFNGVSRIGDPDVIYLSENVPRPHLAVIGHEMAHTMRHDDPELYNELVKIVRAFVRQDEYTREFFPEYKYLGFDGAREEFMGEVLSDGFMSDKFWQAIGRENPNLLSRLYTAIIRMLHKAAEMLGYSPKTARYLTDFDHVMEIAGRAMARYAAGVSATDNGETPVFNRRDATEPNATERRVEMHLNKKSAFEAFTGAAPGESITVENPAAVARERKASGGKSVPTVAQRVEKSLGARLGIVARDQRPMEGVSGTTARTVAPAAGQTLPNNDPRWRPPDATTQDRQTPSKEGVFISGSGNSSSVDPENAARPGVASRSDAESVSRAALQHLVDKHLAGLAHRPEVHIVDTAGDIAPAFAGKSISGAVWQGRIYLVRDGLTTAAAGERTLWHELLHYGLRHLLSRQDFIATLGELYARDRWIRRQADNWLAGDEAAQLRNDGESEVYVRARAVDEALAALAETRSDAVQANGLLARAWHGVARWVARMAERLGFHEAAALWRGVTRDEARALIRDAFAALREGRLAADLAGKAYTDAAFAQGQSPKGKVAESTREDSLKDAPLSPYLLPEERDMLRADKAQDMVDLLKSMPSAKVFAAAAVAGRAALEWYLASEKALRAVFGEDAPRFIALLAATSPKTCVEVNFRTALTIWKEWVAAGRPSDKAGIEEVLHDSLGHKDPGQEIFGAWYNNVNRALSTPNPADIVLSGPKVNSFRLNLLGNTREVTNDAWMAKLAGIPQSELGGLPNPASEYLGKSPRYLALSVLSREAAEFLSSETGESWDARAVQETAWAWVKTVWELALKAKKKGEPKFILDLIKQRALIDELVRAIPDFSTLLADPENQRLLEAVYGQEGREGNKEIADRDHGDAGRQDGKSSAPAGPFPQVLEAYLDTAAEILQRGFNNRYK